MKDEIVKLVATLIFVGLIIALIIWRHNEHRKVCESKGGVYYSWRGAEICVAPGAVIK